MFLGLQTVAAPTGILFVILLLVFLGVTGEAAIEKRLARLATPEAELAAADWIEVRVATASGGS